MSKVAGKKERGKGSKKRKGEIMYVALAILAVLTIVVSKLYLSQDGADLDGQRAHLSRLIVPPDGSKLYSFMLKEIPDIVSDIPCACCAMNLDWCYKGGCPPT